MLSELLIVNIILSLPRNLELSIVGHNCNSMESPSIARKFLPMSVSHIRGLYPVFRGESNSARGIFKALHRELSCLLANRRSGELRADIRRRYGWAEREMHSLPLITTNPRGVAIKLCAFRLVKKIFSHLRSLTRACGRDNEFLTPPFYAAGPPRRAAVRNVTGPCAPNGDKIGPKLFGWEESRPRRPLGISIYHSYGVRYRSGKNMSFVSLMVFIGSSGEPFFPFHGWILYYWKLILKKEIINNRKRSMRWEIMKFCPYFIPINV